MLLFNYKLEMTNYVRKGSVIMLTFLMENIATIIITVVLVAVVALVVRGMIRDRKAGKCCGGCSGCSGSSGCHGHHPVKKPD